MVEKVECNDSTKAFKSAAEMTLPLFLVITFELIDQHCDWVEGVLWIDGLGGLRTFHVYFVFEIRIKNYF